MFEFLNSVRETLFYKEAQPVPVPEPEGFEYVQKRAEELYAQGKEFAQDKYNQLPEGSAYYAGGALVAAVAIPTIIRTAYNRMPSFETVRGVFGRASTVVETAAEAATNAVIDKMAEDLKAAIDGLTHETFVKALGGEQGITKEAFAAVLQGFKSALTEDSAQQMEAAAKGARGGVDVNGVPALDNLVARQVYRHHAAQASAKAKI